MFGFGEKKKLKNETDDLNFDDFDDLGFDDDADDPASDRKASTFSKWTGHVKDSARAKRDDVNFRRQVMKAALPKDYTPVIDTVDTASNEIGKLWREQEKEWDKHKQNIRSATRPFSGLVGAFGLKKLQGWMEGEYESKSHGAEPSQDELDTLKVQEMVGDIFAKAGGQQAQIAEHQQDINNAQYEEESDSRQKGLKNQTESNAHLRGINRELASNRGYTEQVTNAYYSKTLELQARSLITQQRIFQTLGMYRTEAIDELKHIHKNTGLPDFLKLEMSEVAREQYMRRVYTKALEPFTGIGQRVSAKILGKVRNKLTDFWANIGEGAQALREQNEDADQDESGGATGLYKNIFRGMMLDGAIGKAADKANEWASPKIREFLNSKGMDVYGNSAKAMLAQLPAAVNRGLRDGFGNGILDGIADFFDLRGESIQANRNVLDESDLHLDKAAFMDNKMRLAIIDVIPGWLKKIYETAYYGIHKKEATDLQWDHLRGGFTERKELVDRAVDKVIKKDNIIRAEEAVDNWVQRIDPDQYLSEKGHKFLRDWLVKERNSSGEMHPWHLLTDKVRMPDDIRTEYMEKLPTLLKIPEKALDRIMNAENMTDLMKVMASPSMKSANDMLTNLSHESVNVRSHGTFNNKDIETLVREHPEFRDDFVKMKILKRNLDGSLEINENFDEDLRKTFRRKDDYRQNSGYRTEGGTREQYVFDEDYNHYDPDNKFKRMENFRFGTINLNDERKQVLRRKEILDGFESILSLFGGMTHGDDYVVIPGEKKDGKYVGRGPRVILKSSKEYAKYLEKQGKPKYDNNLDDLDSIHNPKSENYNPDWAGKPDYNKINNKLGGVFTHDFNFMKKKFASGGEIESFAKGGDIQDIPNVRKQTYQTLNRIHEQHPITKNDVTYKINQLKSGATTGEPDQERVVKTHGGEFVVGKDATDKNRQLLEDVNKLGAPLVNKDGSINSVYYKTFGFKSAEEFNQSKEKKQATPKTEKPRDQNRNEILIKLLKEIDFEKSRITPKELDRILDDSLPTENRIELLRKLYSRQFTSVKRKERSLGGKLTRKLKEALATDKLEESNNTEEIIKTIWNQVRKSDVKVSSQEKAFILDKTNHIKDRISRLTALLDSHHVTNTSNTKAESPKPTTNVNQHYHVKSTTDNREYPTVKNETYKALNAYTESKIAEKGKDSKPEEHPKKEKPKHAQTSVNYNVGPNPDKVEKQGKSSKRKKKPHPTQNAEPVKVDDLDIPLINEHGKFNKNYYKAFGFKNIQEFHSSKKKGTLNTKVTEESVEARKEFLSYILKAIEHEKIHVSKSDLKYLTDENISVDNRVLKAYKVMSTTRHKQSDHVKSSIDGGKKPIQQKKKVDDKFIDAEIKAFNEDKSIIADKKDIAYINNPKISKQLRYQKIVETRILSEASIAGFNERHNPQAEETIKEMPKVKKSLTDKLMNKIRPEKPQPHPTQNAEPKQGEENERLISEVWKSIVHEKIKVESYDKDDIFNKKIPSVDRLKKVREIYLKNAKHKDPFVKPNVEPEVEQPKPTGKIYTGSKDKSNVLHTMGDGIKNKRLLELWKKVDPSKIRITEETYKLIRDENAPIAKRMAAVQQILKTQKVHQSTHHNVKVETRFQTGSINQTFNANVNHTDRSQNVKSQTYKTLNGSRHDDQRTFVDSKIYKPKPLNQVRNIIGPIAGLNHIHPNVIHKYPSQPKKKVEKKVDDIPEFVGPKKPKVAAEAKTPITKEILDVIKHINFHGNHHTEEELKILKSKTANVNTILKTAKDILKRQDEKGPVSKKNVPVTQAKHNREARQQILENVKTVGRVDKDGHEVKNHRKTTLDALNRAESAVNDGNVFTKFGKKVKGFFGRGEDEVKGNAKKVYDNISKTVNHATEKTLAKVIQGIDFFDRGTKKEDLDYIRNPRISVAKRQAKALTILAVQNAKRAKQDPKAAAKKVASNLGKQANLKFDKIIDTDKTGHNVIVKNKLFGIGKKLGSDAKESAEAIGKDVASKGKKLLKDVNLQLSGHTLHRDRTLTAISSYLKEVENPRMYNLPIDLYFKDKMSKPFVTKQGFISKSYFDQGSKKVILNPSQITGAIVDRDGAVIATLDDLATRQVVTRSMKPYKLLGLTKELRRHMKTTEFAAHKFGILAEIKSVKDKIDKAKELKDKYLIDQPVDVYNRKKDLKLQAVRFKARMYLDVDTGNILWTHHDITGDVRDLETKEVVLTKAEVADGLFDVNNEPLKINKFKQIRNMALKRGKEVYDKYLSKHVNKHGGKLLNWMSKVGEKKTGLNYDENPIDVYVAGEDKPRITALQFKSGEINCNGKAIKSHSGISDVVKKGDEVVISDEDIQHGLVDAHGEKLHLPLTMSAVGRFAHYAKAAMLPKNGLMSKAWNFLKLSGDKRQQMFDDVITKAKVAFDVFLVSNMNEPILTKVKFEQGEYISKNSSKIIHTPEYIDGPVLDSKGDQLISQENVDKGELRDREGNKIKTHAFSRDASLSKKARSLFALKKRMSLKKVNEKATNIEDIRVKGSDEVLLKAEDIKAGKYFRKDNGKPVKTYKDIAAGVVNDKKEEIVGKKELKEGLETTSGKSLTSAIALQGMALKVSNLFRVGSWMWERNQKHKDEKDPKKKDEKSKDKKHSWIGKLIGGLIAPLTAIAGGLALKIKKALNETFIGAFGKLLPKLLGKKSMIADAVGVLGGLGGGRGRGGRIGGMLSRMPMRTKLALGAAGAYGAYKGYGALEDHWGGSDDGPDASEGAENKNQPGLDANSYRAAQEEGGGNKGGLWNGIKDNAGTIALGALSIPGVPTAAWKGAKWVKGKAGEGLARAGGYVARKGGELALRGGTGLLSRAAPWLARAAGAVAMTGEGMGAIGAAAGGIAAAGAALLPAVLVGAAVAAVGYGAYWVGKKIFEAWKDGKNPWNRFRMAQYGFDHNDSATTEKIAKIETLAQKMVHVTKHGVGFKADDQATIEIFKILGLKDEQGNDIEEQKKRFPNVVMWFRGRFIRVYASYVQALNKITGKGEIGDLQKLDRDQQTELLRQVHFTNTQNNPYFGMTSPFEDPGKCEFGFKEVDSISRRLRSKIDELPKPKAKAKGEFKVSGKDADSKPRPKPTPEVKTEKKPADGSNPDTAKPNTPTKEVVKEPNIHDVIDHTVSPENEAAKLKDEFGKKPIDSIQAATRQVQFINKASLAINRMHTQAMTQTTIATTKATDSIFDQIIDSFTTRGKQLWGVVKDAGAKLMNGDFLQSGKSLVKGGLETARGVMTDGFEIGHSAIQKAGAAASRIGGEVSNAVSGIGNFFTGDGGELSKVPQAKGNGWNGVKDTLLYASRAVGTDPAIMAQIAAIESGFRPEAKAKTSSATGLFQFTDPTWKEVVKKHGKKYGIDSSTSPLDARANALMGAAFIKDNVEVVKSVKGGGATAQDIYMAHFLGPGGVKSFLRGLSANPSDLAQNHVAKNVPRANKDIFYSQSGQPNSLQQVYNILGGRLATRAKAFGVNLDELRSSSKVANLKQSALTKGMSAITGTANVGNSTTLDKAKNVSASPKPSAADTVAPSVGSDAKQASKKINPSDTKPAKIAKEVAKDKPAGEPKAAASVPSVDSSLSNTSKTTTSKPSAVNRTSDGVSDAEPLTPEKKSTNPGLNLMNKEASKPTLSPVERQQVEERNINKKMQDISSGNVGTQVNTTPPPVVDTKQASSMESTNAILNKSLNLQDRMLDKLGDIHKAIAGMITGQKSGNTSSSDQSANVNTSQGLTTPQMDSGKPADAFQGVKLPVSVSKPK